MNKKYYKNIEKQKHIKAEIERLEESLVELAEEQAQMEKLEVLKEYQSIDISLDEFLNIIKNYKKQNQKQMERGEKSDENTVE